MTVTVKLDETEDLLFGGNKAYIDLIPAALWHAKIAKNIGARAHANIDKFVAERAGYVCELCGAGAGIKGLMGKGATKFKTELRFEYDETRGVGILRRLLHVCNQCGQAIHLRQTQLQSSRMPPERSPYVGAVDRLIAFSGGTKTKADIECELSRALEAWDRKTLKIRNYDISIVENAAKRLVV